MVTAEGLSEVSGDTPGPHPSATPGSGEVQRRSRQARTLCDRLLMQLTDGPSVGTAYAPVLSGASPWPLSGDSVRPSSVGPCCAPTLHGEDVGPTLGGGAVGCRTGLWVPG